MPREKDYARLLEADHISSCFAAWMGPSGIWGYRVGQPLDLDCADTGTDHDSCHLAFSGSAQAACRQIDADDKQDRRWLFQSGGCRGEISAAPWNGRSKRVRRKYPVSAAARAA